MHEKSEVGLTELRLKVLKKQRENKRVISFGKPKAYTTLSAAVEAKTHHILLVVSAVSSNFKLNCAKRQKGDICDLLHLINFYSSSFY